MNEAIRREVRKEGLEATLAGLIEMYGEAEILGMFNLKRIDKGRPYTLTLVGDDGAALTISFSDNMTSKIALYERFE